MAAWDDYKKLVESREKNELTWKLIQEDKEYVIDLNGIEIFGTRTIENFFKERKFTNVVTKIECPDYSYIQIESDGNITKTQESDNLVIFKTTSDAEARELYRNIKIAVAGNDLTYSEEKSTEVIKPIRFKGREIPFAKEISEHYFNSNGRFAYSVIKHQGEGLDEIYIDEYRGGRLNFTD